MKTHSYAAMVAIVLSGVVHGQTSLLDWSDAGWGTGTTIGTGLYNDLSGAGGAGSAINELTYDLGGGLTAKVSATRDAGVSWQNGVEFYGTWAPGVTAAGSQPIPPESGLFGFGISDGSDTTGALLTIEFSRAVMLDSITFGDLDIAGGRDLVKVGANNALFVQHSAATAPGIANNGTNLISLTGIDAREDQFGTAATSAWTTIGSGSNLINSLTMFLSGGSSGHGIWVSDVKVTASPIPEPSTYALVLGLGTLALVVVRRRLIRRS